MSGLSPDKEYHMPTDHLVVEHGKGLEESGYTTGPIGEVSQRENVATLLCKLYSLS